MASCPKCGQPYPEGLRFCGNCGYELGPAQAEGPFQTPAPIAVPPSPPKKRRLLRNILAVVVVVIIVLYAVGTLVGPSGSGGRQTWQQYGMSIQYPSGVKTQYLGVLNQQADSSSGEAEWLWNGANTGLVVAWLTTNNYNVTASLRAIQGALLGTASNVVQSDQGNATIASHSWRYLTFSFTVNKVSGYATFAGTYYSGSGRLYILAYVDTSSGTLQSLESYGNTFTG